LFPKILHELFAILRELCTLGFVSQFPLLVFGLSLGVSGFNFRFPEFFEREMLCLSAAPFLPPRHHSFMFFIYPHRPVRGFDGCVCSPCVSPMTWTWLLVAMLAITGCGNGGSPAMAPGAVPIITAQPASATIPLDSAAVLTVAATGTGPLS
jgi:hypothetical protein